MQRSAGRRGAGVYKMQKHQPPFLRLVVDNSKNISVLRSVLCRRHARQKLKGDTRNSPSLRAAHNRLPMVGGDPVACPHGSDMTGHGSNVFGENPGGGPRVDNVSKSRNHGQTIQKVSGAVNTKCSVSSFMLYCMESALKTPGDRLRHARQLAGYTFASELGRAVDIPDVTARAHENGHRGFRAPTAEKYADHLRRKTGLQWITANWLLFGDQNGTAQELPGDAKTRAIQAINAMTEEQVEQFLPALDMVANQPPARARRDKRRKAAQ